MSISKIVVVENNVSEMFTLQVTKLKWCILKLLDMVFKMTTLTALVLTDCVAK